MGSDLDPRQNHSGMTVLDKYYYNVLKFLHKCIKAICEHSKQIIVGIDEYNP